MWRAILNMAKADPASTASVLISVAIMTASALFRWYVA